MEKETHWVICPFAEIMKNVQNSYTNICSKIWLLNGIKCTNFLTNCKKISNPVCLFSVCIKKVNMCAGLCRCVCVCVC